MFQDTERFKSVTSSITTLLCLTVADEMQDVFEDTIEPEYGFIGFFFTFLFTAWFLIVIANIFIYLIQVGFTKALSEEENFKKSCQS